MKANDIEIRLAVPADATDIAALLLDSFLEYEMLYTPEGFRATTADPDMVQQRMNEGPVWIAFLDERIVGTVAIVAEHADSLYIRGMAVLPSARGKAIGKTMLTQVEDYARKYGFKRMFLSTTPFLDRAIALYEHFGFCRTADGSHDLFGTPLFTMEKSVSSATN
jgi:GNAT superfamily N-acetyltransferase